MSTPTPTELGRFYVVDRDGPDGTLYVYPFPYDVPNEKTAVRSPDGTVQIVRRQVSGQNYPSLYLIADHVLREIRWDGQTRDKIVGYFLDPALTPTDELPGTLTVEQYAEMRGDEDRGGASDPRRRFYVAHRSRVQDPENVLDMTGWRELVGGVDQHREYSWDTGLSGAAYDAQLRHLRPGYLTGVWDHVARALRQIECVREVYTSSGEFAVRVALPLDRPVMSWETTFTRSGKLSNRKKETVRTTTIRRIELRPPYSIRADTKAEAVAELREAIAEAVELIESAKVVWCTSCDGQGWTAPGRNTHLGN